MNQSIFTKTYGTMYFVDDMKKSVAFYKEIMGLTPTWESPEWTEFGINGHSLCLHLKAPGEWFAPNGTLIGNVKNIKTLVESLKKKGVEFYGEVKEVHPGAYSVGFKDPSGNVLSMFEDTNPPRK